MDKIAFLGAGNIAQAIMGGLVQSGTPASALVAADPSADTLAKAAALGVGTKASNPEAVQGAGTVILCVKPDMVPQALAELPSLAAGRLFISVAAGVTSHRVRDLLGGKAAVVRCMPNTPALVRQGMTALYAGAGVSDAHKAKAEDILGSVGATLWVGKEADLNAVTAVSGSGPAYFFYLMEAMIDAALAQGLPEEAARKLVVQTALGSALMVSEQAADPAVLRRHVTSPGGTTEAAINSLTKDCFPPAVAKAIEAACQRSVELAKN